MCSPTDRVTGRPERWTSFAIWVPLADAPTTRTPPAASWPELRYCWVVRVAIDGGTRLAKAGILEMLQPPEARTTARQCQSPGCGRTRYPDSVLRTDVTVVWVCNGAEIALA